MKTESLRRSAICAECGKRVRICIPAGGDGSVDIYVRHTGQDGKRCGHSRAIVVQQAN